MVRPEDDERLTAYGALDGTPESLIQINPSRRLRMTSFGSFAEPGRRSCNVVSERANKEGAVPNIRAPV
jgi:hypothetical protein